MMMAPVKYNHQELFTIILTQSRVNQEQKNFIENSVKNVIEDVKGILKTQYKKLEIVIDVYGNFAQMLHHVIEANIDDMIKVCEIYNPFNKISVYELCAIQDQFMIQINDQMSSSPKRLKDQIQYFVDDVLERRAETWVGY